MRRKQAYARLKATLEKRRAALRRVLRQDLAGLHAGVGLDIGDSVDNAVDGEFHHVTSQLAETESRELAQIEDALGRMRDGSYGTCDSCEGEIPLARLQALPYATRCVNCQRLSEQRRGPTNSRIDWSMHDDSEDEPRLTAENMIDLT